MKKFAKKVVPFILIFALLLSYSTVVAADEEENALRTVYEPITALVAPPTVIQEVDTIEKFSALQSDDTPPQVAWFTVQLVEEELVVPFKKRHSATLEDVLAACKETTIPLFEIADAATADVLAKRLFSTGEFDTIIASASKEVLLAAHETDMFYNTHSHTYAYIATGEYDKAVTVSDAHAANAHMVIVPDANRETVEYLQKRFLSVTLRRVDKSTDRDCVGAAVDCGANGVVIDEPDEAYSLYESVTEETFVRRAFVVGHRAAPTIAPENTVEGMIAAYEAGADAVECDIYLTKDNHLLLNHNGNIRGYTTDTTAKGHIATLTREELKQYTLKAVGDNDNCKFAFLDEFFDVLKTKPDKMLVVEIKDYNQKTLTHLRELVEEYGIQEQLVFICFSMDVLKFLRAEIPDASISFLYNDYLAVEVLDLIDDSGASASPAYVITPETVAALHYRGVTTNIWTVNGIVQLQYIAANGAQFLTTDNPDLSAQLLEYFGDMSCQATFGFTPTAVKTVFEKDSPAILDYWWLFAIAAVVLVGATVLVVWSIKRKKGAANA